MRAAVSLMGRPGGSGGPAEPGTPERGNLMSATIRVGV